MDPKPALKRSNAHRNGKYKPHKPPCGFDLDIGYTSFRIHGDYERDIDFIYSALDLSGPGDFCLPPLDWDAAMKLDPDLANPFTRSPHNEKLLIDKGVIKQTIVKLDHDLVIPFTKSTHSKKSLVNEGVTTKQIEDSIPSSSEIPKIAPPLLNLPSPNERKIGQGKKMKEDQVKELSKENEGLSSNGVSIAVGISPGQKRTVHIHNWMIGESLGRGSSGTVYSAINQ